MGNAVRFKPYRLRRRRIIEVESVLIILERVRLKGANWQYRIRNPQGLHVRSYDAPIDTAPPDHK